MSFPKKLWALGISAPWGRESQPLLASGEGEGKGGGTQAMIRLVEVPALESLGGKETKCRPVMPTLLPSVHGALLGQGAAYLRQGLVGSAPLVSKRFLSLSQSQLPTGWLLFCCLKPY